MECPKCGYVLGDLDAECPRCKAERDPTGGAERRRWVNEGGRTYGPGTREELATWLSEGRMSAYAMAAEEGGTTWIHVAALLGVPTPPPASAEELSAEKRRQSWSTVGLVLAVLVGLMVIVVPVVALVVGLAVRNAGQTAKQARKAEDVRAINDACWIYENDTGRQAGRVSDLMAPTGPRGYNGPYLRSANEPTDPYSGRPYTLTNGEVSGPADVTLFLN